jgi:hypothetical protein
LDTRYSIASTDSESRATVTLYRTLLHEHHDFFLASQHPSARPTLRKLARNTLCQPECGDMTFIYFRNFLDTWLSYHMLAFIYLAYFMMASLLNDHKP